MAITCAAGTKPLETPLLRQMFEARRRVFVDLMRWDLPVADDRYEIDQYDDANAVYLIVTDEHGNHLASARLLRTEGPHILGDLFPGLSEGPVPAGPDIVEITRFCLDRRLSAPQRREARDRLISALVDHGLASGIAVYTGVAELGWLRQVLAFGWRCDMLGPLRMIGGKRLGALRIHISAETPALLAPRRIYRPTLPTPLASAA